MAYSVAVELEGTRELRRALRRAESDLSELKAANRAAAEIVVRAQLTGAPRRTGQLAANIRSNRAATAAIVVGGGKRVPYAGPIHWGWVVRERGGPIRANPWVAITAQRTEPIWLRAYLRDVEEACQRVERSVTVRG